MTCVPQKRSVSFYDRVWDRGRSVAGRSVHLAVVLLVSVFSFAASAGRYLVIDLSGGPDAAVYPVSRLDTEPEGGWTVEHKTRKLVLRRIEAGTFTMGCDTSDPGYFGYEAVPHPVTISKPFYMGVFEVTQKQYELVTGRRPSVLAGDSRPVESVSWNDIRGDSADFNWPRSSDVDPSTFIGRLRARTGIRSFDIPTDTKWEYACRAGTTTALNTGKNLTGTDSCPAMAAAGRYFYNCSDGRGGTVSGHAAVGSYQPNAWGLYDMHGNVWEWCLDWYRRRSSFTSAPEIDPVGPSIDGLGLRMQRGGGFASFAQFCRSADRAYHHPCFRNAAFGFRVSCMVEGRCDAVSGGARSDGGGAER